MLRRLSVGIAILFPIVAQQSQLSGDRIRAHVKYLASDELQGRGVGTDGERLATRYIASQLKAEGVQPAGDNGTFFQRVPMVAVTTLPDASLMAVGKGSNTSFSPGKEFVGTALSQKRKRFRCRSSLRGHGISAPEFGWDDYKGQNLHGKVLVYFTNEPTSRKESFAGAHLLRPLDLQVRRSGPSAARPLRLSFTQHQRPAMDGV